MHRGIFCCTALSGSDCRTIKAKRPVAEATSRYSSKSQKRPRSEMHYQTWLFTWYVCEPELRLSAETPEEHQPPGSSTLKV